MGDEIRTMSGKVILEWDFKPSNFLEVAIKEEGLGYRLLIDQSKAVATIDAEKFDAEPDLRNQLHTKIYKRLQAAQLIKQTEFKLEDSRMTRINPDGKTTQYLEPKGTILSTTIVHPLDKLIHNSDGKVIADTKQDRLDEMDDLSGLLVKYSDNPALNSLLKSWESSYNDPQDSLFHLYEIRDALKTVFGSETNMKRQVGISNDQNKRFGELCNVLPLREGRHRGKALGELRSATADELKEARDIAKAMIDGYLRYLTNQTLNQEN